MITGTTKDQIPPPGTKVKMVVIGWLGNKVNVVGTIEGEPYQHGYISKSGSWGLYSMDKYGPWYPCYKFLFRQYKHRRKAVIQVNDVVEIIQGW